MSSSLFERTEHICYSANRHTCVTTPTYDDQLQNVENEEISICILLNLKKPQIAHRFLMQIHHYDNSESLKQFNEDIDMD